jgi:hypothetical protein
MRNGGKLVKRPLFDDLLHMVYTDHNGKMKMVDKDTLFEQGIDPSIPDAISITTAKDKGVIVRPSDDDVYSDPDYEEPPQYSDIGI